MSNPIDIAVGERIRHLRKERRITQSQLAGALGLTFQQVQKYEKARNRISASKLVEIAKIFNVDVADLFLPVGSYDSDKATKEQDVAELIACVETMDRSVREQFIGLVGAIARTH